MKKKYIITGIILGFITTGLSLLYMTYGQAPQEESTECTYDVFPVATAESKGWGYDIKFNGKIFIRQDMIPALQGHVAFKSKEDAAAVAELVIKKIVSGNHPSVSIGELKKLNVIP